MLDDQIIKTENKTIMDLTGIINQLMWNSIGNGTIKIKFYINDSAGNIGFNEIIIFKDIYNPKITLINPQEEEIYGKNAPMFNFLINESNLDSMWYIINNDNKTIIFNSVGQINQLIWESLPMGNVQIQFYANDSAGNIGNITIKVFKAIFISNEQGNSNEGKNSPEILIILVISIIGIIIISSISIVIIKKKQDIDYRKDGKMDKEWRILD